MLERYCDVLIIGTEIPGLITAAFLARRGLTVHVLDLDPYAGNVKEPDPFCVAHLHSKLLRSIMGRLNIPESDIHLLTKHDSPLQIIFSNKRIDISRNPVVFYEELDREFPNHREELKIFYEKLAQIKHQFELEHLYSQILPTSFWERRQFFKFVKTHGLDQRLSDLGLTLENNAALKSFILAQLQLVTHSHVAEPFAFQVAEILNPSEGEILSVQGGHHFLKKLFIDRIVHHEGAYRPNAHIEKMLFHHGIFEGITQNGLEGNILARTMIWNTHLKKLLDYLPGLLRFYWLKRNIQNLKPQGYWFSAKFLVPKKFIPPPMQDNLLLIHDPQKPLTQTNYLYLQIKNRDQEKVVLTVSYLLAAEDLNHSEEYFTAIHNNILEKIKTLLPFSEKDLGLSFPLSSLNEHQDTLFPLKDNDFEIFKQTAVLHPVYYPHVKSFADLFPMSYKTPAPNFFITSPEILGSLGYEGKFMLGLKVTDHIWGDVEKAKKRAMKLERRIA